MNLICFMNEKNIKIRLALASALIANGVHLVGRSFKYHRPRGFFGAGVDEPYAMVQLLSLIHI